MAHNHNKSPWIALKQRAIEYGILEYGQLFKLAQWLNSGAMVPWAWFKRNVEPSYSYGKRLEEYLDTVPFQSTAYHKHKKK